MEPTRACPSRGTSVASRWRSVFVFGPMLDLPFGERAAIRPLMTATATFMGLGLVLVDAAPLLPQLIGDRATAALVTPRCLTLLTRLRSSCRCTSCRA
jgi:hypothetical protein